MCKIAFLILCTVFNLVIAANLGDDYFEKNYRSLTKPISINCMDWIGKLRDNAERYSKINNDRHGYFKKEIQKTIYGRYGISQRRATPKEEKIILYNIIYASDVSCEAYDVNEILTSNSNEKMHKIAVLAIHYMTKTARQNHIFASEWALFPNTSNNLLLSRQLIVDNRITNYVDEFFKYSENLIISAYKEYEKLYEVNYSEDDSDEDPFSENGRQLKDSIFYQKIENSYIFKNLTEEEIDDLANGQVKISAIFRNFYDNSGDQQCLTNAINFSRIKKVFVKRWNNNWFKEGLMKKINDTLDKLNPVTKLPACKDLRSKILEDFLANFLTAIYT